MTNRIKYYRLAQGLSQKQAALFLEISTRTLQRYEKGITHPQVDVLHKMEKLFEASSHQFYTTED